MRLFIFSLLVALLPSAGMAQTQSTLASGFSHFTITQNGKTVGATECTVATTASGYTITSRGELHLTKLSYSFSNTQHLDHMLNLVNAEITGTVNGSPVSFSVKADPTGRQFNISVTAKGATTQNTVDRHRHLALLADLDAAGYVLLNRIGMEKPQISWALIPKQTGLLVPTTYMRDANVRGRFNGHDIDVEHTTVTVSAQNAISVELFYQPNGRLMEADVPEQNFYVARDGFRLVNRPKYAPPRSPEGNGPPEQQNGAPQYSTPQGAPPPQVQQQ